MALLMMLWAYVTVGALFTAVLLALVPLPPEEAVRSRLRTAAICFFAWPVAAWCAVLTTMEMGWPDHVEGNPGNVCKQCGISLGERDRGAGI